MRLLALLLHIGRRPARLVRWKIVAMALIGPFLIGPLITVLPIHSTVKAWAAPKTSAGNSKRLDINSASTDELIARLRIGQADARQIVNGRPYGSTVELARKKVISKATYEKIKNEIMVKVKGQRNRGKDQLVPKKDNSKSAYEMIKNQTISKR